MLLSRQSSPYVQFSPSGSRPSPHHRSYSSNFSELDKYFSELLAERHNLSPFMQVLPNCTRLLNQEIMKITNLIGNSYGSHESSEYGSLATISGSGSGLISNGGLDLNAWSMYQSERLAQQAPAMAWRGLTRNMFGSVIKKVICIEVPVDKYPNFNFVGRLLGPRGNSLKRVENCSGCRIFIRGKGSVRDPEMEEKLRDKPGYEQLNEPLHVLIEAELPVNVIDFQLNLAREIIEDLLRPVDEAHDYFKKQQLRELAMLNGTSKVDSSSCWSGGSMSPFSNSSIKRAKTRD